MDTLSNYWNHWNMLVELQLNLLGIDTRDDEGAISTEMAVATGVLVAVAAAAGIIFIAKARSNANNIPDNVTPPG